MGSQREAMILQDGHSWGLQAMRQPGNGQATTHVTKIHSKTQFFKRKCSLLLNYSTFRDQNNNFFRVRMIIKSLCEDDKLSDKLILK